MGVDEKGSIINFFIDEMSEHLEEVTESLLCLESSYDTEAIHRIFRIAHTMKGSSAMMGFSVISRISHKFEDILGEIRSENRTLTPELVDQFFSVIDTIKNALSAIADGKSEEDIDELLEIEKTLDKVEFFQTEIQQNVIEVEKDATVPGKTEEDNHGVIGRIEELAQGFKSSSLKADRPVSKEDFQKNFNLYAAELMTHSGKVISNLGSIIDSDFNNLDLVDASFSKVEKHMLLMNEISETYSINSLSEVFTRYTLLLKKISDENCLSDKELLFSVRDIFIELEKRIEIFKKHCTKNDIMKIVSFLLAAFPENYKNLLLVEIPEDEKISFPIKELISDLTTGLKIPSLEEKGSLEAFEKPEPVAEISVSPPKIETPPVSMKAETPPLVKDPGNIPATVKNPSEEVIPAESGTEVEIDWFSARKADAPINRQFLDFFVEEANACVEYTKKNIGMLVDYSLSVDLFEDLIRNSHTIKGSSSMVGLKRISSLGKSMEFTLREVQNREFSFNKSHLNLFMIALQGIEILLGEATEKGYEETEVEKVNECFTRFFELQDNEIRLSGKKAAPAPIVPQIKLESPAVSEKEKPVVEKIPVRPVVEEVKPAELPKKVESRIPAESIEGSPGAAKARAVEKKPEEVRKAAPSSSSQQISVPVMMPEDSETEDEKEERRSRSERRSAEDRRKESSSRQAADEVSRTVRVGIEKLDNLINLVGELVINKIRLDQRLGHLATLVSNLHSQEKHLQKVGRNLELLSDLFEDLPKEYRRSGFSDEGLQEFSAYDELKVDLVSIMSQMTDISDQFVDLSDDLNITTLRIGKITVDLQENIMKVRMFPVDRVFQQFPRVVRDLSRKTGKKIQLRIVGEETELDKTVIEKIGDPMMHLVRNAIDHGVESPSERTLLGKEETGTISLSAYHKGNHIVIEIEDDGRGLEIDKIKTSAIAKGIITEREANQMTKKELMNLIFLPGFSTSKSVTDISGRGVGMDVVRSNINELKGDIQLESEPGIGTKITVKLPLTLAIIQALIVETNGEDYVIPINSVVETTIVFKSEVKYVGERRVFYSRNTYIPIISLSDILGKASSGKNKSKNIVVVVTSGEQIFGLEVDELKGKHEIVVKNLGHYLKNIKNIASATILGDGRVLLILDISSIALNFASSGKRHIAMKTTDRNLEKDTKKVYSALVVDDSPTVRNIEKNILESAGYRVVCAENGFDGFEKLSYENFDIVITDVEMPKMNGFELTSKIRSSNRFKDVPIIIITTKINDEDKRKGLNLGANLYLGKPFEQDNLLVAVKRLIGIE